MSITDPISDALVMIKNASNARKEKVDIKSSNIMKSILEVLKKEGFIRDYRFVDDKKQGLLRIYLKFTKKDEPVIRDIKRISKPGLRIYVHSDNLPKVLGGLGLAILSTSKGIMTDKQAQEEGVGGEVVCHIL